MGAFSIFSDKNKRKKDKKSTPTVEEYYIRLARRATAAKFVCIIIIASAALLSFSERGDELTAENLKYMFKFVDLGGETTTLSAGEVYFDSDSDASGALVRGDLAVLTPSGLSVYDFKGARTLKADFNCDHPQIVNAGRDIIVYDVGGSMFRIFTSYSEIMTENLGYPINCISASGTGSFVISSSENGYRGGFYVYDSQYRFFYSHAFGEKYLDCVAISADAKFVTALTRYSENGVLVSELIKFDLSSETPVCSFKYPDELPLKTHFLADGSYLVLTDRALRFFGAENTLQKEIFFKEKSLLGYDFSDEYVIITYNAPGISSQTELDVYGSGGEHIFTGNYEGALLDKKISGGRLWVLTHGSLAVTPLDGGERELYPVASGYRSLIPDAGSVILLSDSSASYFSSNPGGESLASE